MIVQTNHLASRSESSFAVPFWEKCPGNLPWLISRHPQRVDGSSTPSLLCDQSYWLLATPYWLPATATSHWLLATGFSLLATGHWLPATGYWLLASPYWPLATPYWLLPTDYWPLAAFCQLSTTYPK